MVEYEYTTCPVCGIHYAVDKVVMKYKSNAPTTDKHRGWYCPNGHSLVFTTSEVDRQRQRAERAEQERARLLDELAAAERKIKRQEKRAAAGTCPCCNRTFTNMGRHMKTKHPDYAKVVPLGKKGAA